jgi:hypothetical protein
MKGCFIGNAKYHLMDILRQMLCRLRYALSFGNDLHFYMDQSFIKLYINKYSIVDT